MGTARRQYMDEFKREALELLVSSGRPLSQIAGSWGFLLSGCGRGATEAAGAMRDRRGAQHAGGDPACWRGFGYRECSPAARERALAHGARDLKKNTAHLLGTTEMKFRIIEDQRETFPIRVLCDVMGVSAAGIMPGAAGPKAHARQPIAPCSPRSGAFIWPSRPLWRAENPRGFARPGAHGEPWPGRAAHAPSWHKGNNSATVPDMHYGQPSRLAHRSQPAQSELRCRSAQSGLACRHNLCANLGRLALSGCRARSFHQEDCWMGDA